MPGNCRIQVRKYMEVLRFDTLTAEHVYLQPDTPLAYLFSFIFPISITTLTLVSSRHFAFQRPFKASKYWLIGFVDPAPLFVCYYWVLYSLIFVQTAEISELAIRSRIIFTVTPCINNIQHFNYQLTHTTLKNVELLKHSKISKTAPTCFGLQGNHHQGATVST